MLSPELEANRQFHHSMEEWAKDHLPEVKAEPDHGWIQIDAGKYYDVSINGQQMRICGPARVNPEIGWAWFGDGNTHMNLKNYPVHGKPLH